MTPARSSTPVQVVATTAMRLLTGLLALAVVALGSAATGWAQPPALRPLAEAAGVSFGAAVDPAGLDDAAYRALLVDHVVLLSTRDDLSMAVVQPQPGVFDFSRAEAIVDFAVEHDMTVRGHELIGGALPEWVTTGTWTAESLGTVLREHVGAVIGHFRERNPGVVVQWDVVGDAFQPDGTPRPTIWQSVIGQDHLRIAFEAARAADPDAQLFYDDFYDDVAVTQDAVASGVPIVPGANAERTTCDAVPKCSGVRAAISALVEGGVPIDGIGFQSHLFSPDPVDLTVFAGWVDELGLRWAVTEFDVPLPVTEIDNPTSLQFQAEEYAAALAACVDAPACDTFVTWGISDRFSPIPAETGGVFDGALWFDVNDQPKPAFDAMAEVLAERAPATTTSTTSDVVEPLVDATPAPSDDGSTGADGSSPIVALSVGAAALAAIAAVVVLARRRRPSPSTPPER
jgi:endo-1,4-beta-xylanase